MKYTNNYEYLLEDLTKLKGVGKKTTKILRKKKINNLFDLLWRLPQSYTDRSQKNKINELKIGKIHTLKILVKNIYFLELEIYQIELFVKIVQEKLIVFFLTVMRDILEKSYH